MNEFIQSLSMFVSPEFIAIFSSIATTLVVVFKMAKTVKDLAQKKQTTTEDVKNAVISVLENTNKDSVDKAVAEILTPLQAKIDAISPVLNAFAKILALSQENTPESKLAILELLQNIGKVDTEVIEQAKAEIVEAKEQEEEKAEAVNKELDEIIGGVSADVEGRA